MQKCVFVRRVADCPQYDTASTTFSSLWCMNCVATLKVGALFRLSWQPQLLAARQTALLVVFPRYRPPSSTWTRLGSPCNRDHFMTIKAGNVVDKVRRRLHNVCAASSSAAILHPVSIMCRNTSLISSAKIKQITNDISFKQTVRYAKGFLTAKTEWELTSTEQSKVGTFTGILVLLSRTQIHSYNKIL